MTLSPRSTDSPLAIPKDPTGNHRCNLSGCFDAADVFNYTIDFSDIEQYANCIERRFGSVY